MSGSRALVRITVSGGRWLLPWLSVLLVSASLAAAMNSSLSASRATGDGQRHEIALAPVGAGVPSADAAAEAQAGQVLGGACAELFGSYNWWLFSSGRHGPCGLDPDAGPAMRRAASGARTDAP
jgi:hypothetical protein